MKITEDTKIGVLMAEAFEKCQNTDCGRCPIKREELYDGTVMKACYLHLRLKDLGETE